MSHDDASSSDHPSGERASSRPRRMLACAGAALTLTAACLQTASAAPDPGSPRATADPAPRTPPKTIVGGVAASTADHPWVVALSSRSAYGPERSGQFCGGTLVAPDRVLTAAHCLFDDRGAPARYPDLAIIQGRTDLGTAEGREVEVTGYTVNPGFRLSAMEGDWAVLRLAEPLTAPVLPLAGQGDRVYTPGTAATVLGWGDTTGRGTYPDGLRKVRVPVASDAACAAAYPGGSAGEYDAASMVCAGPVEGGRDACAGDSGGPMLVDGRLAGIVSWGRGCALPMTPGVYTRVAAFSDAIAEVVAR